MKRTAELELQEWKVSEDRRPLLVLGARQVGKTWMIKKFAEEAFKSIIYVNFEKEAGLRKIFEEDYDPFRIVKALEVVKGVKLSVGESVLILDEIQTVQGGLAALKYFNEDYNELHVIAAGSLLGVSLGNNDSFPVGQVDFLHMFPMSFSEFLLACGQDQIVELLEGNDWELISLLHPNIVTLLKDYYFVGGMPQAVLSFSRHKSYEKVRKIQESILYAYNQDFSKHAPNDIVPRIQMIWNSVLSQLSKENKKFIYGIIKEGARAKDYEIAINWLENYGLIYKVSSINKAHFSLSAYADENCFKIYAVDLGLLGAMGSLSPKTLIDNQLFSEFKGALAEQYVLQELKAYGQRKVYYWSNDSGAAELDFIFEKDAIIYPIEVKANENLQAKSLKTFLQKYPEIYGWRSSLSKYRKEARFGNMPLYAVLKIMDENE
jgi:predicted AAA+ superfamily ATPase